MNDGGPVVVREPAMIDGEEVVMRREAAIIVRGEAVPDRDAAMIIAMCVRARVGRRGSSEKR